MVAMIFVGPESFHSVFICLVTDFFHLPWHIHLCPLEQSFPSPARVSLTDH